MGKKARIVVGAWRGGREGEREGGKGREGGGGRGKEGRGEYVRGEYNKKDVMESGGEGRNDVCFDFRMVHNEKSSVAAICSKHGWTLLGAVVRRTNGVQITAKTGPLHPPLQLNSCP